MNIRSVSYKEKERILMKAFKQAKPLTLKQDFEGSAAAPFVGHYGYPAVNVGLLAPPQHVSDVWKFDAPRFWAANNHSIQNVVDYRAGMIKSTFTSNVRKMEKLVEIAQDVALAKNTLDVDVQLKKKPRLAFTTDSWHAPLGPSSALQKVSVSGNPKIPTKVQKFFDDTDVKAVEAMTTLFSKNIDETRLSRMLSVGAFGKKRCLVPTRWSITATDDMLAKDVLKKVKTLPVGDIKVHVGDYLGNYYVLMFFDQPWSYELFEMYVNPGELQFSTDYEPHKGRTKYAQQCAGGFYSVRLAIAEQLSSDKRQCSVLALRFITDEYLLPLGVWVTREAARNSLNSKPIRFASRELMLTYVKKLCKKKFGVDVNPILQKSMLLKQKTLNDF